MNTENTMVGPYPGVTVYLQHTKPNKEGKSRPLPSVHNIKLILQRDPRWAGRIWHNLFTKMTMIKKDGTDQTINPRDTLDIWDFLQTHYGMDPSKDKIADAIELTATRPEAERDPLREELEDCLLQWKEMGEPKGIHSWLFAYLGVERSLRGKDFRKSLSAIGSKFLISLIARALNPGCKVDNVLILQGRQGTGKSTAFNILGGEFFSDSSIDIRSKDAYQSLPGVWIHEFAELDSMRKRESTAIKAFLSSRQDRYRPSYGRSMVEVKRRTVFVGSTNESEFLTDSTGNRRFWPVRTNRIDLEGLRRERAMLLGEAVQAFLDGAQWHLTPAEDAEFSDMRECYLQTHPWEEPIVDWLTVAKAGCNFVTVQDVLDQCLDMPKDRWTKSDKAQIGDVLNSLGWKDQRRRINNRQVRGWVRPS